MPGKTNLCKEKTQKTDKKQSVSRNDTVSPTTNKRFLATQKTVYCGSKDIPSESKTQENG